MPRPLFSLNFSTWATCHGNKDLDLRNNVERMATITDYSNERSLLFDDSGFSSFKDTNYELLIIKQMPRNQGSAENNVMHERKEFPLKRKLTTTSLLGPRISCHFFISSSSSKGVSFIAWKTHYKVLVLIYKCHKRCFKSFTANNAIYISDKFLMFEEKKKNISTYL